MEKEEYFFNKGYNVTKDGVLLNPKGKVVGTYPQKKGLMYEYVSVLYNGKISKLYTHRLQAFQKFGNKLYNPTIVVRHLNGNSLDNSYNNIAIGTKIDNARDIPENKRKQIAHNANMHSLRNIIKYSEEIVDKATYLKNKNMSYEKIAKELGISTRGQAWYIVNVRRKKNI